MKLALPNVHIEARPKGRLVLSAFVWLLAAGLAGTICGFAATGHFDIQTRVAAGTAELGWLRP